MDRMTYRDILRTYARGIASGHNDADLMPTQRRIAEVLVNLASNAGPAACLYPPTDATRDDAVRHLADIVWDARPLVDAAAPHAADDFSAALDRAIEIVRGV